MKVWHIRGVNHDCGSVIISGERTSLLIDPGTNWYQLLLKERIKGHLERRPPLSRILLTHRHFDHSGGADWLSKELGDIPILIHPKGANSLASGNPFTTWASRFDSTMPPTMNSPIVEGDSFDVGGGVVTTIELPGHTEDSVGFLIEDKGVLVAGDTIPAAKSPARWDMPTGNLIDLLESVKRIAKLNLKQLIPSHDVSVKGRKAVKDVLDFHIQALSECVEHGGSTPESWPKPAQTSCSHNPK